MKLRLILGCFLLGLAICGMGSWDINNARAASRHPAMLGLDFVNSSTGWAVGYYAKILKTTNGGRTWTMRTLPNTGSGAEDAFFTSSVRGWLTGGGNEAWRTWDGGRTWRLRAFHSSRLKLLGPTLGWGVNGGVDDREEHAAEEGYAIRKTVDGGKRWTLTASGSGTALTDIDFVNQTRGWAVGCQAVPQVDVDGNRWAYNVVAIMSTDDGGLTWSSPLGPSAPGIALSRSHLLAVDFKDTLHGWAVGDIQVLGSRRYRSGLILRTADGGATWTTTISHRFTGFTHISMATRLVGWVTGEGGEGRLLKTVNGGRTWDTQFLPRHADGNDVDAVSPTTAFVAGDLPIDAGPGIIAKTVDGGRHWVRVW